MIKLRLFYRYTCKNTKTGDTVQIEIEFHLIGKYVRHFYN